MEIIVNKVEEVDEQIFDIAECFPIGICQEIFGYLQVTDLLQCSLVNLQWHEIIGTSEKCMEKIRLKVCRCRNEDKEILLRSIRNYQHLKISDVEVGDFLEQLVKQCKGRWKSVIFFHGKIVSEKSLMNVMKLLEPSLEELEVGWTDFEPKLSRILTRPLTFPKLTKLVVNRSDTVLKMVASCTTLSHLHLLPGKNAERAEGAIQQLLQGNVQLKELTFKGIAFFDRKFSRHIPIKLKSLHVTQYELAVPYMPQFLETHIDSLESLFLYSGFQLNCLEVILRMRKLKVLTIDPLALITVNENWHLNRKNLQNSSIESLRLYGKSRDDLLKSFLRLLPNLKHLLAREINDEIFNLLAANSPKLESLKCKSFRVSPKLISAGNPFPNFKKLEVGAFNYNLEEWGQILGTESFNKLQCALKICPKRNKS